LAAAQQAARVNNCSSLGIFSPPPTAACPAINSEINRLQASLRPANAFASFFGTSYARSPADQLRDALFANRCEIPSLSSGGGGRSLCVRTCDGYYFPVSAGGGNNGGYRTDAEVCQATYAGAGTAELFIAPGDDVANARSLANNKRYGDQPYAFQYRTAFNAVCVAELHEGLRTLGATAPVSVATVAASLPLPAGSATLVALPQPRPRWSEDPETLANAAGALRLEPIAAAIGATEKATGMRIVGAGYYNTLLDLQARSALATAAAP
jgi:hypothetical protein